MTDVTCPTTNAPCCWSRTWSQRKETVSVNRKVKAIAPVSADKIYERIIAGPRGHRPRQCEKVVGLCARAWSVAHRLHPDVFNHDIPNPWLGVTKNRRSKAVKPSATREQVYSFAKAAIKAGYPEAAAAAVICFERLQRPENVLAGYIRWTDYRGREAPTAIEFSTTRPARSFCIRYRTATALCSTAMQNTCSPRCRVATFR